MSKSYVYAPSDILVVLDNVFELDISSTQSSPSTGKSEPLTTKTGWEQKYNTALPFSIYLTISRIFANIPKCVFCELSS